MRKLNLSAASIVLAGLTAFAAPAQANLLTNGGFETGSFSGWVETGDAFFNGVQCSAPGPSVYEGNCSAFFGSTSVGGIAQTVDVGSAGLTWELSFAFQPDGAAPSSLSVLFGGQTLLWLANPAAGGYTLYSFSGVTTAQNMTLAFDFVDEPGFLFLDAVSLTTAAPIPEPETYALMLGGLALTAWAARRRQRG